MYLFIYLLAYFVGFYIISESCSISPSFPILSILKKAEKKKFNVAGSDLKVS